MRRLSLRLHFMLLAVVTVLLAACGAARPFGETQPDASAPPAPAEAGAPDPTAEPIARVMRTKGDPNAPVKVIEYSDFQ